MSVMIKAKRDFESPRITAVEPGDGDYVLQITWEDGSISRVDLTEPIFRLKYFRPLRDKTQFRAVNVADWGWAVSWGNDLDFSGEKLWEMAKEQANAQMLPSEFRAWLKRHDLTQQAAAELLGISKRSVAYYSTGAQPITRTVVLALKGLETELEEARSQRTSSATQPSSSARVEASAPALPSDTLGRLASEHERLRQQLASIASPYEETLRRIRETTRPLSQTLEYSQASTELMQAVISVNATRDLIAQAMKSIEYLRMSRSIEQQSELFSSIERSQKAFREIERFYRLPRRAELNAFRNILIDMKTTLSTKVDPPRFEEFVRVVQAMRAPWVNVQNSLGSMEGFAELAHLGKSLALLPGFDPQLTQLLRSQLGDWRAPLRVGIADLLEPVHRLDLYRQWGLNPHLVDFPPRAFTLVLGLTGIVPPDYRTPRSKTTLPPSASGKADQENEGRSPATETREAAEWLERLEGSLRVFVDSRMTEAFGARWVNRNLDPGTRKWWHERRESGGKPSGVDEPRTDDSNFSNYVEIILRDENWNAAFRSVFHRKEFLQESFNRLYPARILTIQGRGITEPDLLYMAVEVRRLLKTIGGDTHARSRSSAH